LRPDPSHGLWLIDRVGLCDALDDCERSVPRLSESDNARASALAGSDPRRAAVWRAGRIALRLLLERAVPAEAPPIRKVPFALSAHGEPALPGLPLHFSLSDAGPYLLVGVVRDGRIGVDLELPRTMTMSAARQARVIEVASELGASGSPPSPLQAWTRIEAFTKARGPSLARVLTELGLIGTVAPGALERARHIVAASGYVAHDVGFPAGSSAVAAVAVPTGRPIPPLVILSPVDLKPA
jgi:phosphopantetheinyl transferase